MFSNSLESLPPDVWKSVHLLCVQLVDSTKAKEAALAALHFFHTLRNDVATSTSLGFSDEDRQKIEAAWEPIAWDIVDVYDFERQWLQSKTPWDQKLMSQTPDLPESIFFIFSAAYEARTNLLQIGKNLQLLVPQESDRVVWRARLKPGFEHLEASNPHFGFARWDPF